MIYNWSTIGHTQELSNLEHDLAGNILSHGYLFMGPGGIGKTHVARIFAGILQCPHDFCRRCPTCIQVEKNIHQDTIQLLDDGESIKIATIRDIVTQINFTPQSRYKVVIIENMERLTLEASNALLKTLEEPPSQTIFIGTANGVQDTLDTIISRMRVINFKRPSPAAIHSALTELYPTATAEQINEALALSCGASGKAKSLMENPEELQELRKEFDRIAFLYEQEGLAERIVHMGVIAKEGKEVGAPQRFLELLLHFLHDKLHRVADNPATRAKLARDIEYTQRALVLHSKNVNTRLILEQLSLNLIQ